MNQQPVYPNLPASRHTMTVGVRLYNGVRTQCSIFSTNHGLFGYLDAEGEVYLDLHKAADLLFIRHIFFLCRETEEGVRRLHPHRPITARC